METGGDPGLARQPGDDRALMSRAKNELLRVPGAAIPASWRRRSSSSA
jgi:hypothetical protein